MESITCPICEHETLTGSVKCPLCSGAGKVKIDHTNFEKCNCCSGSGRLICNGCSGKGDIMVPEVK